MGNLLSLNPKIHRLRADAKKHGGFAHAEWDFGLSGQSEFRFHASPSRRLIVSFSIGSIGSP
jgi:hypothetical protein